MSQAIVIDIPGSLATLLPLLINLATTLIAWAVLGAVIWVIARFLMWLTSPTRPRPRTPEASIGYWIGRKIAPLISRLHS